MIDPVVDELHRYRQSLYEQVGDDSAKLLKHLEPLNQKYANRLVMSEDIKQRKEHEVPQELSESA